MRQSLKSLLVEMSLILSPAPHLRQRDWTPGAAHGAQPAQRLSASPVLATTEGRPARLVSTGLGSHPQQACGVQRPWAAATAHPHLGLSSHLGALQTR